MFGRIIEYTVDADRTAEVDERVRTHLLPGGAAQPGYRGYLALDRGEDRRLVVWLWESEEAAEAGQAAVTALAREHTIPLLSGPALVTAAEVLGTDLSRGA